MPGQSLSRPRATWTELSGKQRRAPTGPFGTPRRILLPARRPACAGSGTTLYLGRRGQLPAASPAAPGERETPARASRCYSSGWGATAARLANTRTENTKHHGDRNPRVKRPPAKLPLSEGVSSPRALRPGQVSPPPAELREHGSTAPGQGAGWLSPHARSASGPAREAPWSAPPQPGHRRRGRGWAREEPRSISGHHLLQTNRLGDDRAATRPLPTTGPALPANGGAAAGSGGGCAPHLDFLADAGRHGAGRSPWVPLPVLLRAPAAAAHHGTLGRWPRPRPARSWAPRPLSGPSASILKNRAVTLPPPQVEATSDAIASHGAAHARSAACAFPWQPLRCMRSCGCALMGAQRVSEGRLPDVSLGPER